MHDIDRTLTEFEPEIDALESDQFEFVEETEPFGETDSESPLDESEEMELASQALEITDEFELDQFLGNLIRKAGRAVGKFVKTPIGRALGGILKRVAKKALPIAGGALGGVFGGPVGAAIGSKLASAAGRMFGLELEGLSPEDQIFELSRRFVRFASAAARNAAQASPICSPQAAAKAAVVAAARRYAPGLLRAAGPATATLATGMGRGGRWIRRGRKIILLGA